MDSLVADSKNFSNESIQIVAHTFLENDEAGAYDWINQNWEKFDNRSKEVLAATSARAAIQKNDVATALEWASHLSDINARKDLMNLIEAKRILDPEE